MWLEKTFPASRATILGKTFPTKSCLDALAAFSPYS